MYESIAIGFDHILIHLYFLAVIDIGAWLLANVTPLVTKLPPGILPNGSPCIPQWTVDYFLCQGGWCEPTICINVLGLFWIHTYDVKGFCTSRPPDGQACVDKAPQIMDYNGPYPNIIDKN